MCHGDFHLENILLSGRGPLIIDWEGCMRGEPATDVANTCLWIRSALTFGSGFRGKILRRIGRSLERAYLTEYEKLAPGQFTHLDEWIAVLAICRLRPDTWHEYKYLKPMINRVGG